MLKALNQVIEARFEPTTPQPCKRTINHLASLAKWLIVRLRSKWLWVQIPLQSLKLQISPLFQVRSSLTFRQLQSVDSQDWTKFEKGGSQ